MGGLAADDLAGEGGIDREGDAERNGGAGAFQRVDDGVAVRLASRVVEGDRDDQALARAGDRQPGPGGVPDEPQLPQAAPRLVEQGPRLDWRVPDSDRGGRPAAAIVSAGVSRAR